MSNKTKEEIKQLATKKYRNQGSGGGLYTEGLQEGRIIGFKDGYTQCQETLNARIVELENDVKYWQYEFDHWYKQAIEMANKVESLTSLAVIELSCKKDKYEIPIIGSSVIICGEIQTTIIRIENDKYYFLDNEGIEKWDTLHVIELIP